MKNLLAFILTIFFNLTLIAQNGKEFTVGPVAKTNGIGAGFSFVAKEYPRFRHGVSLDINNLKHGKEIRIQNQKSVSPRTYFYGKQYRAVQFNPSYQFFSKAGTSGRNAAALSYGFELGPSFALLRPVYLIVLNFDEPEGNTPHIEEYDPTIHDNQDEILGDAGWQKGFDQLSLRVGLHSGFLVNIDFDQDYFRKRIQAGASMDFYFSDLQIMYQNQNKFFGSVFIRYQIGKSR